MAKSIVGLVLGLVGSIGNLCLSIFCFVLLILAFVGRDIVSGGTNATLVEFSFKVIIVLSLLTLWFLVFGIMGSIYSSMMNKPLKVKKGGIGCLVSGILTINLFMVIGGIMAIVAAGSSHTTNTAQPPVAATNY